MKNALSLVAGAFGCMLVAVPAEAQTTATPAAGKPAATVTPGPKAPATAHWSYQAEHGPKEWGKLSPAYAACEKGTAQSPINLSASGDSASKSWKLDYQPSSLRIAHHEHVSDLIDNGHTIQVTVDEGSTLTTGRGTYQLKQFHFHTPSEHTVDGKNSPMEMHFVHQSADGKFAVVAALFAEGAANENLAKLIANFPKAKGQSARLPEVKIDLAPHLPANEAAYYYMGSFTTPPCTESVEWFIFRDPVRASAEQLNAFAARLSPNNRPVQSLNGRAIDTVTTTGVTN